MGHRVSEIYGRMYKRVGHVELHETVLVAIGNDYLTKYTPFRRPLIKARAVQFFLVFFFSIKEDGSLN